VQCVSRNGQLGAPAAWKEGVLLLTVPALLRQDVEASMATHGALGATPGRTSPTGLAKGVVPPFCMSTCGLGGLQHHTYIHNEQHDQDVVHMMLRRYCASDMRTHTRAVCTCDLGRLV
jgi:hypothetical protein